MGRNPKWGERVTAGERGISGPKVVILRDRHEHYGAKSKPIPAGEVPLEDRSGSVEIVFCMEGLTLHTSDRGNEFPNGVGFKYNRGYEVLVNVFARGHEKDYPLCQRGLGEATSFISGISSPVVTSRAARTYLGEVDRTSQGGTFTKVLDVRELNAYLKTNLPLIGVDVKEVPIVIRHIEGLLSAGHAETLRKIKQLEQRRAARRS